MTKSVPKELLLIVDVPAIQVIVEECIASGIEEVIFITGRGKGKIEDHFDYDYELEHLLEARGKNELLKTVRDISSMIRTVAVRQKEPLGLGHAVLCAKDVVGDEPFLSCCLMTSSPARPRSQSNCSMSMSSMVRGSSA